MQHIYHYLDDFAVLGHHNTEQCAKPEVSYPRIRLYGLNVPLTTEKQAGLSTTLEFLGIVIDTIHRESLLSHDKLIRLWESTTCWKPLCSCTKLRNWTHC